MKFIQPKIIFCCEEMIDILIKAARLENFKTKFIIYGKRYGILSLDYVLKLQSDNEVNNYLPRQIDNIKKDAAFLFFSSGTTGLQKAVLHSYEALLKVIFFYNIMIPIKNYKILWYVPPFWIANFTCIIRTLLSEGTRIIHKNFNPDETSKLIEEFKANNFLFQSSEITEKYVNLIFYITD